MVAIKAEAQEALLNGEATVNLILEFSDGSIIDNDNIVSESMQIEESICESESLEIGNVFASVFKIRTFDTGVSHEGLSVVVKEEIYGEDGNLLDTVQLGKYDVKSDQRTADKIHRDITAYDGMSKILPENIVNGIFGLPSAGVMSVSDTIPNFLAQMFDGNGHGDIVYSIPDTAPNIDRTFTLNNTTSISGADFLMHLLSLMGAFGFLDNQASFDYYMSNESDYAITDENGYIILATTESDSGVFTVILPHTTADLSITDGSYIQGSFGYEDFQFRYITGVKIVRTEKIVTETGRTVEASVKSESETPGITNATVTSATFISIADDNTGTYEFNFDGTNWKLNGTTVVLSAYGITVTGTPVATDVVVIDYSIQTSETEKDIEYLFGSEVGNVYTIYNNIFLTNKDADELEAIATELLTSLRGFTYVPSAIVLPQYVGIRPGDVLAVTAPDSTVIKFPVLQRTLTGIQGMRNTITAKGTADMAMNANSVEATIQSLGMASKMLLTDTNAARSAADSANAIASATNQHFWADSNGIHISYQEQESYNTNISGANLLANANGILLRSGKNILSQFTPTEVKIGEDSKNHSIYNASGAYWYTPNAQTPYMSIVNGTMKDSQNLNYWNMLEGKVRFGTQNQYMYFDGTNMTIDVSSLSISGSSAATESYADDAAEDAVDELDTSLNQQSIFNRLTNNGVTQGIYLATVDNVTKLYINADYIKSGTIETARLNVNDIISTGNIIVGGDDISDLNDDIGIATQDDISGFINQNLLSDSYWDESLVDDITSTAWSKESSATISYDWDTGLINVAGVSSTTTNWGIYQDISVTNGEKYTISAEVGTTHYIGIAFIANGGTSWPSDSGGWSTADDGRIYKTVTATNVVMRVYVYGYSSYVSKVNKIKVEQGESYTGWYADDSTDGSKRYITQISGRSGICVHDAGDTSNYANINSSGMSVYSGGVNVASFGSSVRLGQYATGNNYIEMSNNGFICCGYYEASGSTLLSKEQVKLGVSAGMGMLSLGGSHPYIVDSDVPAIYGYGNSSYQSCMRFCAQNIIIQGSNSASKIEVNYPTLNYTSLSLTSSGNLTLAGGVYVHGHSSAIGTCVYRLYNSSYRDISSSCNVTTSSYQADSVTLSAGIWLILFGAAFKENATGWRQVALNTVTSASSLSTNRYDSLEYPGQDNQQHKMHCQRIVALTSDTTYYLYIAHSAGTTLRTWPYIIAVRIA